MAKDFVEEIMFIDNQVAGDETSAYIGDFGKYETIRFIISATNTPVASTTISTKNANGDDVILDGPTLIDGSNPAQVFVINNNSYKNFKIFLDWTSGDFTITALGRISK